IDRLVHREGYTLKGAKKALAVKEEPVTAPQPAAPAASLAGSALASQFAYRARLIALRTTLVNALHDA
ncbi:MAG: transcriptional regulator, partial [Novosphingobium sp.]